MRSSVASLARVLALALLGAGSLQAQDSWQAMHVLRSEPGGRRLSQSWFDVRGVRLDGELRTEGDAERAVRGLLREHAAELELDVAQLRGVRTVLDAQGGFAVFEQTARVGIICVPVVGTELKVVWDRQRLVRAVLQHTWRGLEEPLAAARLSSSEAMRMVEGGRKPRLVAWVDEEQGARAAWELSVETEPGRRVFVDARDGAVLGSLSSVAHASGTGAFYWQSVVSTPTITTGSLYYLDGSGYLQGPYARVDIINGGPQLTRSFSPTNHFVYSPSVWQEAGDFYQVTLYQVAVWMKVLLVEVVDTAVAPRGFDILADFAGTSRYEFGNQRWSIFVQSSSGNDHDGTVHEVGHAISHSAGFVPELRHIDSDALHEGLADFLSLIDQSNVRPTPRPDRNWDSGEVPPGGFLRTLDSCFTHGRNLIAGDEHNNGIIFGAALRDLTLRTGRSTALRLAVQCARYLNPPSTFDDAVEALVLADRDLYLGVHATLLRRLFWIRELSGWVPTNPWLPAAVLESAHPYDDDVDQTFSHTIPGANALIVTLHPATRTYRTSTGVVDLLYVQDANHQDIPGSPFSGELRGQSLRVPGDTVHIRLYSRPADNRVAFGFRCESIVAENPSNQTPRAAFTASTTTGDVPFLVIFDARTSSDPDGQVMLYALDPDDGSDIVYLDPAHPVAEHFYNQALFVGQQTHQVTLTIFDQHGGSDTMTIPIVALPHIPRAIYQQFGDGCTGSLGIPTITPTGALQLGNTLSLQFDNLPQHAAILVTGFSNFTSSLGSLPIDLALIGAPNCALAVSPEITVPLSGTGNRATYSLTVPNLPALDGLAIYHQALVPDTAAGNALGAVLSDAWGGMVGM